MKAISLLIFPLLFVFVIRIKGQGHDTMHIRVIDSLTNKSVEFATLSINKTRYFSATENGCFFIPNVAINEGDSLRFSSIGYTSKILINKSKVFAKTIIYLIPESQNLVDVNVSVKKAKETTFGIYKRSLFGFPTYVNHKYALYIPNKAKQLGFITNINILVSDACNGIEMPIKVNVYSVSNNGEPDKPLIEDDIIVYNPERKRTIEADLNKYNVSLPENGFFIVAEILSAEYYNPGYVYVFREYRRMLPALSYEFKKKKSENYSMSMSLNSIKKRWYKDEGINYSFNAKIQIQ